MEDIDSSTIGLKIIVVGEPNSGKTSTIHRFCDGEFSTDYQPTIGVEFSSKFMTIDEKKIELRLWDIAGQDQYAGMSRVYYNGALGAIVMCDISNNNSIEGVLKWKLNIDDRVLYKDKKIPCILVANKSDLITSDSEMMIQTEKLEKIVKEQNFQEYVVISANTNQNLDESMFKIGKIIMDLFGDDLMNDSLDDISIVDLRKRNDKQTCC